MWFPSWPVPEPPVLFVDRAPAASAVDPASTLSPQEVLESICASLETANPPKKGFANTLRFRARLVEKIEALDAHLFTSRPASSLAVEGLPSTASGAFREYSTTLRRWLDQFPWPLEFKRIPAFNRSRVLFGQEGGRLPGSWPGRS